ncbi:MAG: hypothetical protein J6S40_08810, partial [Thermoguttaceae bacterium]|nr:hypothetical protein [Thermoguttaceae bacterium]
MSIFNFFRNAQNGLGMTSKKSLGHRRFQLENLEERTLLDANPIGATGDDFPAVTTMIVVTDAIPTVTQVDDPSADVGGGANVITEAAPGDTIYVSVYAKSTAWENPNSDIGFQGGYVSLYYDTAAFTAGEFTESAIFPELSYNDGYSYSKDNYISAFGGTPSGMTDSYGQTQWALLGTHSFTVTDTAAGEYEFSDGQARNAKGAEKYSWNLIREDYPDTFNQDVEFASTTFTVNGDTPPEVAPIQTAISVSYEIPTETEIDEVTSLSEAKVGDTIYVSVYAKSTDP